jgi:hypothetical protein
MFVMQEDGKLGGPALRRHRLLEEVILYVAAVWRRGQALRNTPKSG